MPFMISLFPLKVNKVLQAHIKPPENIHMELHSFLELPFILGDYILLGFNLLPFILSLDTNPIGMCTSDHESLAFCLL